MRKHVTAARSAAAGFTLLEVLVSLVILSVGLLGLGLLQASSLKASFGSNQRTVATNLAAEMLDLMRANRGEAYRYIDASGSLSGINTTTCQTELTVSSGDVVPDDIEEWQCEVAKDLPNPVVLVQLNNSVVLVQIQWTDTRQATQSQTSTFALNSRL